MQRDEIIDMARQAGMRLDKHNGGFVDASEIKRFAKLVAAKECEACADNVETYYDPMWTEHYCAGIELAKMIRARGEA